MTTALITLSIVLAFAAGYFSIKCRAIRDDHEAILEQASKDMKQMHTNQAILKTSNERLNTQLTNALKKVPKRGDRGRFVKGG